MKTSVGLAVLILLSACSGGGSNGAGGGGGGEGGGSGGSGGGANNAAVASISLNTSKVLFTTGQVAVLGAEAKDSTGAVLTGVTFTWSSSAPAVASVADGAVTALTAGTSNITASSNGVTSAPAELTVVTVSAASPDSDTLIATALTAGTLSDEQALIYRVYAAFGDPRLPAGYKGNDTGFESDVLEVLNARFDSLTMPTQDLLAAFLLRPSNVGSWLDPKAGKRHHGKNRPTCRGESSGWTTFNGTESKINVWYDYRIAGEKQKAEVISLAVEQKIWPTLIGTDGFNVPLDDDSVFGCYGGDKRLDVYLVPSANLPGNKGLTEPQGLDNKQAAVYIMIRDNQSDTELRAAVAHEFMHAIQWSYKTVASQGSYDWMRDATANWAIDTVYGKSPEVAQFEHRYADCFTTTPHLPLYDRTTGHCSGADLGNAGRDYGAYLFFQFLEKSSTAATVKATLVATTTQTTSLEAVDSAISGGFKDQWPKFAKSLWNQPPVDSQAGSFKMWDDLTEKAKAHEVVGDLGGAPEVKETLAVDMPNLSIKYNHFTFADAQTRSLMFYNGFYDQIQAGKNITVKALWQDANDAWQEEDWSGYEYVGLCRDLKNQRAKDLIIIVANAEKARGGSLTAPNAPYLMRSNIGCWQYDGTVSLVNKHSTWSGTGRTGQVNVAFQLAPGADALTATRPTVLHSLRAGLTATIGTVGQNYTFTESYTSGTCSFSYGPSMFTLGANKGFLFLNPFPDLKTSDSSLASWFGQSPRAYSGALAENQVISVTVSGGGCGTSQPDVIAALLLTNSAANGVDINPPIALANGDLNGTFTSSEFVWTWVLHPRTQP